MKIIDSKNGKLVLSAMFVTLGMILPFLTGQIKQIGNMLLPMHLPIMLCGLICGPWYGLAAGFLTPLLRSAVFGMPHMFPSATAMAFELGAYGSVIGFLYNRSKWKALLRFCAAWSSPCFAAERYGDLPWRYSWALAAITLHGRHFSRERF